MAVTSPPPDRRLVSLVVVVVTAVWALTMIAALFTGNIQPAVVASPFFGAAVGWATGARIWKNGESR